MKLVPFELGHLDQIEQGPYDAIDIQPFKDATAGVTLPSLSAEHDGRILGCGGFLFFEEPTALLAWIVGSDELRRDHALFLHRAVKRALATAEEVLRPKQIWALVHCEFKSGQRWLERLGFRLDRIFPRAGKDGADYMGYVRRW